MINPIVDIEGHFIVSPNEAEVDHHHDTVWNAKALKRLKIPDKLVAVIKNIYKTTP